MGKVRHELKRLPAKGKPIPMTIWPTWTLILSVLEPLETPDLESDNECSGETIKEELNMPSQREEMTTVVVKEHMKEEPPPPVTEQDASGILALGSAVLREGATWHKGPKPALSAIPEGLLEAQRAGDPDALHSDFPVTVREHVAPGCDPNNPNAIYEAKHEPFPFK